jgi:hypothetical protein
MSVAEPFERNSTGSALRSFSIVLGRGLFDAVLASCEAISRVQDVPRACRGNSGLLAMTRLAKPNRLKSCAWFFARLDPASIRRTPG